MFKINDCVVYDSNGVYKIVDIRIDKDINDNDTEYYILQPAYNNNMTIKIPVNNPKILMREIITKADALSLIESMPEQESIWIDDAKQRAKIFKEALRSGENKKWLQLVKALHFEKQEKSEQGKKLLKIDEDIMKAAEKNLFEEFATALDISPDMVITYIQDHVSKI